MSKGRILTCVLSSCVIIIFTLLSTIMWYHFFDKNTKETVISSQLYISNNSDQVAENIAIETEDSVQIGGQVYSFSVENTGNKDLSYKLLINEIAPSLLKDGCKNNTLLKRSELVYQLSLNNEVLAKEDMSAIKGNVIDVKTIKAGTVHNYELRFWVKTGVNNYLNKHYHYEINLEI